MRLRVHIIFTTFFLIWVFLLVRSAYIQLAPNARLENVVKKQYLSTLSINSRRGAISDRNGEELAVSTASYSLYADPSLVTDPYTAAAQLAPILELNRVSLKKKLRSQRRFVWLKRQLNFNEKEKIDAFKIPGIGFVEDSRRIYPNGHLLSPVLGLVGQEGDGLDGIELFYNEELKGQPLKVSLPKDARGRPLTLPHEILVTNPQGHDIELTIDKNLQFVLEQELLAAIKKLSADGAWGVILDPKTSEVLAMASLPQGDANNPVDRANPGKFRNRALTDVYEPGSTLKPILVAGGLRQKILTAKKMYYCEKGHFKVTNRWIKEADSHHAFENLTVSDILAHSSNIGSAKIALEMGAKKYLEVLNDFGFGQKTGIDFRGESTGLVNSLPWVPHLLSSIGFGHGIAVTALQVANAYSAIANGGILHQPFVVRAIRSADGQEIYRSQPKEIRRVLDVKDAQEMNLMLTAVTAPGKTGELARVVGYPVAGKTGTAQKVNQDSRGYQANAYISSFAGYLPSNDPRLVIYVAVDNPQKTYYAAAVAAPIFARVAANAMRIMNIPPSHINEEDLLPQQTVAPAVNKKSQVSVSTEKGIMPNLKGLTLREVYRQFEGLDINVTLQGRGVVQSTFPRPGESIKEYKSIHVTLGFDEKDSK